MHRWPMISANDRYRTEIPPGTLEMLILKTLKRFGPTHGYGIAKSIQQTSGEVLRVEEGSLYPALQRILMKGWVTAEWVQAGLKRRTRVYQLTPEGRKQLVAEISEYRRVSQAIGRVIQPA
jgi:PadR family transcriptional regulator PadR